MTPYLFAQAVIVLLSTEPTFQAAITALIGAPVTRVLKSNRPTAEIPVDLVPCWVIEHSDGAPASLLNGGSDEDGRVVGNYRQGYAGSIDIALVWSNGDRDTAFDQRGKLPLLVAQLFMRNAQPGGVAFAALQGWSPDQGTNHPRHVLAMNIAADYSFSRS